MFPLLGHQQNPPPPPPLNPRQTVVFSLQRTGAGDVVFSYQFPVAATVAVTPPPPPPPALTAGGGGYRRDSKRRERIEQERNEAELAEVVELLMALAAAGVLD